MTRQPAAPPSGEELARAVTYESDGPASGHPGSEPTRLVRARLERPARGRIRPGPGLGAPMPAPIRPRTLRRHRLILTGELGRDSAVALEAEIDAICESGIDTLVLDLLGLRAIDATGVRVIALRCALCRRRGMEIEVHHVHGRVRQSFVAAGLLDRLTQT